MQRLILLAIALRVAATVLLTLGPWTNAAAELDGWDVERFQQISEIEGRPWVDEAVEYPPGSVALIEAVAQPGVVGTHRVLVVASLFVDLAVAFAVGALGGRRAAAAYLVLGLPLVPLGLLRFDLWAALAAVLAVAALRQRRPAAFALLATAGALVKVWPALVVAAALAVARFRAAALATVAMGAAGLIWLGWTGWTLDPVDQVLSMRGATGWHVESIPGSIEALRTRAEPELQRNAYRIGTLQPGLVLAGRALALAVIATAVALGLRARGWGRRPAQDTVPGAIESASERSSESAGESASEGEMATMALVMVAAVGALIVTSPLLSPQFLLWLTPWAALAPARSGAAASPDRLGLTGWPSLWWLTLAATATTGLVLTVYGPSGVGAPTPALLLLGRDGLVIAAVVVALVGLARSGSGLSGSGRSEDPLRQGGATPGAAGADAEIDEVPDEAGPLRQ